MSDKPRDRPTVPMVIPLLREIYAKPLGGCGCCLHIVTDDGNVEQGCIDFCVETARERGHADCLQVALLLAQMTSTQRERIYRKYREYANPLV